MVSKIKKHFLEQNHLSNNSKLCSTQMKMTRIVLNVVLFCILSNLSKLLHKICKHRFLFSCYRNFPKLISSFKINVYNEKHSQHLEEKKMCFLLSSFLIFNVDRSQKYCFARSSFRLIEEERYPYQDLCQLRSLLRTIITHFYSL